MERFTELHAGVPVLKDKTKMKEAMARLHELEERDEAKKPEIVNGGVAVCPECGDKVLRCYSFCRDCGQRIDWGKKKQSIPQKNIQQEMEDFWRDK